ncbi:hypothetical protein P7K49_030053 [Saguinus oedipus]|uniref:Elongation factor 1 beta central acidic region eukaryote domain-containing protein n=1 Tax=Saguinus oedipus TaxID=9490 RepID=A0ABQ9U129_SAGOE|nr:hypothetical protein P7K49_030053 [Saguinus oedipus]
MATNFLVQEKIWFDKFNYEDAERRFYEQMKGPVAGVSRQSSGPRNPQSRSRPSPSWRPPERAVEELARPPGHSPADPVTCLSRMRQVEPPAKKAATAAEEDEVTDSAGNDDEEDQEAAQLREERLRQSMEKKAKKPGLVAEPFILLDVKTWDDETDAGEPPCCCLQATESGSCRFSVCRRTARWRHTRRRRRC